MCPVRRELPSCGAQRGPCCCGGSTQRCCCRRGGSERGALREAGPRRRPAGTVELECGRTWRAPAPRFRPRLPPPRCRAASSHRGSTCKRGGGQRRRGLGWRSGSAPRLPASLVQPLPPAQNEVQTMRQGPQRATSKSPAQTARRYSSLSLVSEIKEANLSRNSRTKSATAAHGYSSLSLAALPAALRGHHRGGGGEDGEASSQRHICRWQCVWLLPARRAGRRCRSSRHCRACPSLVCLPGACQTAHQSLPLTPSPPLPPPLTPRRRRRRAWRCPPPPPAARCAR